MMQAQRQRGTGACADLQACTHMAFARVWPVAAACSAWLVPALHTASSAPSRATCWAVSPGQLLPAQPQVSLLGLSIETVY